MVLLKRMRVSRRLSMVVGGSFAALTTYAAVSMSTVADVRVGGPRSVEISQNNALLADVLPPPEYVVETYLEANLLASAVERDNTIEVDTASSRL